MLRDLTGGAWDLSEFDVFAAGSDVDFMAHVVEAEAARGGVCVFPGDWYGFRVGSSLPERVTFTADARDRLGCVCIPSVRNGHVTSEILDFLDSASACLLNLNLYPTLAPTERLTVAESLQPLRRKSILSISFSRGFGLTASQLGVALVHKGHPLRARYADQWEWLTYFHNAIAARAFLNLDLGQVAAVDAARRGWVRDWLQAQGLPAIDSGSYYFKSFRIDEAVPASLRPLARDGVVRLCLKPPHA